VPGTHVLVIYDWYKEKKYFCLREGYYYNNILSPTRRGFNISFEELPNFFGSIKKVI